MAHAIAANKRKRRKPKPDAAELREEADRLQKEARQLERKDRDARRAEARSTPAPRFAEWITRLTPAVVAERLGVPRDTVYGWRRGALLKSGGFLPTATRLRDIIRVANGALTMADIYPSGEK